MFTLDTSGLDAFKERLAYARQQLPDLMQKTVHQAGEWVSEELSNGAPVGTAEGPPPSGDAPGRLNASFYVQQEGQYSITVRTSQPQKLEFVTQGTGVFGKYGSPIVPVNKKALFWEGASHPVRSVQGQEPNDFVTPIVTDEAPTADEVLSMVVDDLIAILEG